MANDFFNHKGFPRYKSNITAYTTLLSISFKQKCRGTNPGIFMDAGRGQNRITNAAAERCIFDYIFFISASQSLELPAMN